MKEDNFYNELFKAYDENDVHKLKKLIISKLGEGDLSNLNKNLHQNDVLENIACYANQEIMIKFADYLDYTKLLDLSFRLGHFKRPENIVDLINSKLAKKFEETFSLVGNPFDPDFFDRLTPSPLLSGARSSSSLTNNSSPFNSNSVISNSSPFVPSEFTRDGGRRIMSSFQIGDEPLVVQATSSPWPVTNRNGRPQGR